MHGEEGKVELLELGRGNTILKLTLLACWSEGMLKGRDTEVSLGLSQCLLMKKLKLER